MTAKKKVTRVDRPEITPADTITPTAEEDESLMVLPRPDHDPMAETPIIVSADHPASQLAHLRARLRHEREMWIHHQGLAGKEIEMVETYGLRVNRLYGEIARLEGVPAETADAAVAAMDEPVRRIKLSQMVELQNKSKEPDHG